MKNILINEISLILICFFLPGFETLQAQDVWEGYEHLFTPERHYVAYRADAKIDIDGRGEEDAWHNARWSEYFKDIEGEGKPDPLFQTRFKMLWDNEYLYVLAELEEPHIWAYYDKRDMIVYHENDFEIFIDPVGSTHNYFEFECNAQNTLFDLFLPKPYRDGGKPDIEWDAEGLKSAIYLDGTLNDPSDTDRKWTLEVAIPFSSLSVAGKFHVPENEDIWKINFSRVQWQTEIVDGKYKRKKNADTGKILSENNWVWSPQGVINMHYPERWGMVMFSEHSVDGGKINFQVPDEEKLRKYLWLVYYKQQKYKRENGIFAGSLSELNIPEKFKYGNISYHIKLITDSSGFQAILETENETLMSVDQYGFFQRINKK